MHFVATTLNCKPCLLQDSMGKYASVPKLFVGTVNSKKNLTYNLTSQKGINHIPVFRRPTDGLAEALRLLTFPVFGRDLPLDGDLFKRTPENKEIINFNNCK